MDEQGKRIHELLNEQKAVIIFTPITLLTDAPDSKDIPSVDIVVLHRSLTEERHDAKPFRDAVGTDSIEEAKAEAILRLATAAQTVMLKAIVDFLTTI